MKIHEYQGKEVFRKFGVPTSVLGTLRSLLPHIDTLDTDAEPIVSRVERSLEGVPWSDDQPVPEEIYRHFSRLLVTYDAAGQLDDPFLRRKVTA